LQLKSPQLKTLPTERRSRAIIEYAELSVSAMVKDSSPLRIVADLYTGLDVLVGSVELQQQDTPHTFAASLTVSAPPRAR
jgi:hypothetical protein